MKLAVINFSGNVGKTTVARHLLLPRLPGCTLISVESLNADERDGGPAMRGRQFGELQEFLQTVDSAVVDIGASNVEELLEFMRLYRGSQQDFDAFIVPTVSAPKQQRDTVATLVELARLGVDPFRLKVVFNMVEHGASLSQSFFALWSFLQQQPLAVVNPACRIGMNELYRRVQPSDPDLAALARDATDYKALITQARDTAEKVRLAQRLATRRLASGVVPELDACFAALELGGSVDAAPMSDSMT